MDTPIYAGFLGTWTLDVSSCEYQQGKPPQDGTYRIEDHGGVIHFLMDWTDADGSHSQVRFSGTADGVKRPFAAEPLADALSIDAPSDRELNSFAYWQGETLMTAYRRLGERDTTMRVTQTVTLPDGNRLRNQSVYRKNATA